MRRLLVLVAVLVPLSWFVVGCGGGVSSPAEKKAAQEGEDRTKAAMMKPGGLKGAPSAPTK